MSHEIAGMADFFRFLALLDDAEAFKAKAYELKRLADEAHEKSVQLGFGENIREAMERAEEMERQAAKKLAEAERERDAARTEGQRLLDRLSADIKKQDEVFRQKTARLADQVAQTQKERNQMDAERAHLKEERQRLEAMEEKVQEEMRQARANFERLLGKAS